MMRPGLRRLLIVGGLGLVFSVGLVCLAPATWLDAALQHASRGTLGLANASGTIWNGAGTLQAILPRGVPVTLNTIRWNVHGHDLLDRRLRAQVYSVRDGQPILDASYGRGGLEIHEARLELPAALAGGLSPTLRDAGLEGRLSIKASNFRVFDGQFSGQAGADWLDAASSLTAVNPLGSYRFALSGTATGLSCTLSTIDARALSLDGRANWQVGQPFTFTGNARPSESYRQELVPLLRILGRETGPGTYRLEIDPNVGAV